MPQEENNTNSSTNDMTYQPPRQNTSSTDRHVRSKRPTSLKLYKLNAQHNQGASSTPSSQHRGILSTSEAQAQRHAEILEKIQTMRDKYSTSRCKHSPPLPHPLPPPPPQEKNVLGNPIVADEESREGVGVQFADQKDMLGVTGRRERGVVVDNEWKGGRMIRSVTGMGQEDRIE
jgi:hypothetical protein